MTNKNSLAIVLRSFQTGADELSFNKSYFEINVADRIKNVLGSECVKKIIIISNGDPDSEHSEKVNDQGLTPTYNAVIQHFKQEVDNQIIICHICRSWGLNPGSATALNEGIKIAEDNNFTWVMCWSPELILDKGKIEKGLFLANEMNLDALGFLRERWWEKTQWNMIQNTGAIWKIETLKKIGLFDKICNGTGETVTIDKSVNNTGKALLAGMEDFHALLKIYSACPEFKWCMAGVSDPLKWDTDFSDSNSRKQRFEIKVARQFQVMKEYVNRMFPDRSFYDVMNEIYKRYILI